MTIKGHEGSEQERNSAAETNTAWQGEHPFYVQADGSKSPAEAKPIKLKTGDELLNSGGMQVLTMPNGEKLTVMTGDDFSATMTGKDEQPVLSKYVETIVSDPPVEVRKQEDGARLEIQPGMTRITYPSGDEIVFDRAGIASVTRKGVSVRSHRPSPQGLPPPKPQKPLQA